MKTRMRRAIVLLFISITVLSTVTIAYAALADDYFLLESDKKVKPRGSVQYIYAGPSTINSVEDIDTDSIELTYWHYKKGILVIPPTGGIEPIDVVYDPVNDRLVLYFDTSAENWPKKCSGSRVDGTLFDGTKTFEASGPGWGWKRRG